MWLSGLCQALETTDQELWSPLIILGSDHKIWAGLSFLLFLNGLPLLLYYLDFISVMDPLVGKPCPPLIANAAVATT